MRQNTRILRRGVEAKPGFPTIPFCPFLNNLYLLLHPVCAQHRTDVQKSFHCGVSIELWSDLLDRQYQKPDVASPLNYLADAASANRSGHCLHKPTLKKKKIQKNTHTHKKLFDLMPADAVLHLSWVRGGNGRQSNQPTPRGGIKCPPCFRLCSSAVDSYNETHFWKPLQPSHFQGTMSGPHFSTVQSQQK